MRVGTRKSFAYHSVKLFYWLTVTDMRLITIRFLILFLNGRSVYEFYLFKILTCPNSDLLWHTFPFCSPWKITPFSYSDFLWVCDIIIIYHVLRGVVNLHSATTGALQLCTLATRIQRKAFPWWHSSSPSWSHQTKIHKAGWRKLV